MNELHSPFNTDKGRFFLRNTNENTLSKSNLKLTLL